LFFSTAPKNISELDAELDANYTPYNFQALANISDNFRKFPENFAKY